MVSRMLFTSTKKHLNMHHTKNHMVGHIVSQQVKTRPKFNIHPATGKHQEEEIGIKVKD